MTNKKTNKSSAKRKLVPAIGMLTVSAMMLSSATYAWFTMSREVEVKNIQMTASVPEDLQISLGKLTDIVGQGQGNPTASQIAAGSYTGLQGNQGRLAGSADNGGATAPDNNTSNADEPLYWSNTADISEYYRLGKIIPASSTNGEDIFFTPDASGNGKTLKDGAKFYQVASVNSADFTTTNLFGWDDSTKKYIVAGTGDKARTTLHAITQIEAANDPWNPANPENASNTYDSADAWNLTNDDGYYVDIPLWFRSSAKDDTTLAVDAYVTTNAGKSSDNGDVNDDELYMAARAVIIYTNASSNLDSSDLIKIRKDSMTSNTSIIDYMYSTDNSNDAVASVSGTNATYGAAVQYNGSRILKVEGRDETTAEKYGNLTKAVVRVWLEGEDPNCWNSNAGQDFNISLKFSKEDLVDVPTDYTAADHDDANVDVDAGTTVTITNTTRNGVAGATIQFTYDGNKWNQTTGSFEALDGWSYTIAVDGTDTSTTVNGADGIAAWLKTNVTKKSDVTGKTYSITEANTSAAATPTNESVTVTGADSSKNTIAMVKTGESWAVAASGSTIEEPASGYYYTYAGSKYYSVATLTAALNTHTGADIPVVGYSNA